MKYYSSRIRNQKCSKLNLKIYFFAKSFFAVLIMSNTFHNWNILLKSIFTPQEIDKLFDDDFDCKSEEYLMFLVFRRLKQWVRIPCKFLNFLFEQALATQLLEELDPEKYAGIENPYAAPEKAMAASFTDSDTNESDTNSFSEGGLFDLQVTFFMCHEHS